MSTPNQFANAIRALAMDAVQQANSGHPGAPMGMADIAEVLWRHYLVHNPANPQWMNRDRFVLSNGHGSMLLYALLHLSGYDLPMEELRNFRQLHSKTPGHPEVGYAPGIETTTGPLGQGLANAVGMAIAEKTLAAQFNQPQHEIIDHFTYAFVGDGCLMEGISHEVCSLAGTLGLGKLIVFYDDNGISIDGEVEGWFSDDTAKRFAAYGWQVIPNVSGHSAEEVKAAIEMARINDTQPTLICCKTIIGFGAPNQQGTSGVHGKALGADEIAAARQQLNWTSAPFEIPEETRAGWCAKTQGAQREQQWQQRFEQYAAQFPELAQELERRLSGELPESLTSALNDYLSEAQQAQKSVATRKASELALNVIGPHLPELLGGSADLAGSNNTIWKGCKGIQEDPAGNYIYYGVREFGMTAIMNGIALSGGFIPYGGTFLVFMDYARNAVRLAALMQQRVVLVYTHDSIGLGEDGPTHQPVEHLASLRTMPNMSVWRPCDHVETVVAWQSALENKTGPTSLILSRQSLPALDRDEQQLADVSKGAYIAWQSSEPLQAIILSTGSEVQLALEAAKALDETGVAVRVVSMPSTDAFLSQSAEYQASVLPPAIRARVAVEASIESYWLQWVGLDGKVVGMNSYGESAPGDQLYQHFGITSEAVIDAVKAVI